MPSWSMKNIDMDLNSFPPYDIDESTNDPFVQFSILRPK